MTDGLSEWHGEVLRCLHILKQETPHYIRTWSLQYCALRGPTHGFSYPCIACIILLFILSSQTVFTIDQLSLKRNRVNYIYRRLEFFYISFIIWFILLNKEKNGCTHGFITRKENLYTYLNGIFNSDRFCILNFSNWSHGTKVTKLFVLNYNLY